MTQRWIQRLVSRARRATDLANRAITYNSYICTNIFSETKVTCDSVAIRIDRQERGSAQSDSRRFNALLAQVLLLVATQPALIAAAYRAECGVCKLDDQLQPPKLQCGTEVTDACCASLRQGLGDLLLMFVCICIGPQRYWCAFKADINFSSRIPP